MHLTFVNSDGLEQVATSVISSSSSKPNSKMKRPSSYDEEGSYKEGGGWSSDRKGGCFGDDSDTESDFFVIDETSPLLLTLDPPGTRVSYMGDERKRYPNKLLSFRIRKEKTQRLPCVIMLTAMGMAVMVVAGFVTMFEDTASVTNLNVIDGDSTDLSSTAMPFASNEGNNSPAGLDSSDVGPVQSTNGSNNLTRAVFSNIT